MKIFYNLEQFAIENLYRPFHTDLENEPNYTTTTTQSEYENFIKEDIFYIVNWLERKKNVKSDVFLRLAKIYYSKYTTFKFYKWIDNKFTKYIFRNIRKFKEEV